MSDPIEPSGDAMVHDDPFADQDLPETVAKRPVTARGAALAGARVVAGLIGVGVAVLTIGAAGLVPFAVIRATPASVLVAPVPTAQQLVCPGAVLRLADESGEGATTASAIGRPVIDFEASAGPVEATAFSQSDAATEATPQAPTLISTPPSDSGDAQPPLLSAAQGQEVSAGEFLGLAAADCGVASGDAWLVGGSTAVGRTTLLTLSNPTEVPATVDLELFGEDGPIAAPGTSGIIVAPNGQRVLALAGFRPDVVSPIVHVMSRGGLVVANLQQSVVRGLLPGGVDIVGSTAVASPENVIPGVVVADPLAVQAMLGGGTAFEDVRTVLRLFAPGQSGVGATVRVIPEGDGLTGTSFELELDGDRVLDVPLDDLAAGSYTVRVDSTAPIVAAVRVTAAAGEVTDLAWAVAAPLLVDRAQVTVAAGPAPRLHLANPTTAEVEVTVGETLVGIPADGSVAIPVEPGQSYQLSGFERLFAAVSLGEGGLLAQYAVHPPGASSGPITIYP
jgi:hypothetical protein